MRGKKKKRAKSRVPAWRVNFRHRTDVPHKRPVSLPKISHACVCTPATPSLRSSPRNSRHVRRRRRREPGCTNERLLTYLLAARVGIFFFFFFPASVSLAAFWHSSWFIYAVSHQILKSQSVGQAERERSRQAARESSSPSCQVGLLLASPLGARKARRKRRRDKERGRSWRSASEKREKPLTPLPSFTLGLLVPALLTLCCADIFRKVDGGISRAFYWACGSAWRRDLQAIKHLQKSGSLHKRRPRRFTACNGERQG